MHVSFFFIYFIPKGLHTARKLTLNLWMYCVLQECDFHLKLDDGQATKLEIKQHQANCPDVGLFGDATEASDGQYFPAVDRYGFSLALLLLSTHKGFDDGVVMVFGNRPGCGHRVVCRWQRAQYGVGIADSCSRVSPALGSAVADDCAAVWAYVHSRAACGGETNVC